LAQELTGYFWVNGRGLGKQYYGTVPDEAHTDMLVAFGWNGWMSHQMPQARRRLAQIAEDPEKLLVVVDPRRSETAARADIHLPIRPGTDALLFRALISIILQEGRENTEYTAAHVSNFDQIRSWFTDFDAREAARVCELDYELVHKFSELLTTRKWSSHSDLGVIMGRHSTLASYLELILMAVCGRVGVTGGNVVPGYLMPLGAHSDERDHRTWRTVATGFPAIMGVFPPNVMPEEILTPGPERLRAVLVSGANPLRSYADTTAYETAFAQLDLAVTIDVAFSETARLSHYVLPARSAYEKWDGTFFAWTFPDVFFQLRRPLVEPEGEPLEESEIMIRLADRLGFLPDIPDRLYEAASGDRMKFGMELLNYAQTEPRAMKYGPYILGKTLGKALGSPNLAALWGLLQLAPQSFRECAARAGFDPGPFMGEQLFKTLLDHPEGVVIGKSDPDGNLDTLMTSDRRVDVYIPELAEAVKNLVPEAEAGALQPDPEYPFVLMAGRHMDYNANTIMRDPSWNGEKQRLSALAMHPTDAGRLQLTDGDKVKVVTEAGEAVVELDVDDSARPGHVVIPHGFGLVYDGEMHGVNVNRLTKNTYRDPIAATPIHRYVPCRVERV
jgi:anaerobic selenocysteine-containing dehydrogenase